MKAPFIFWDSYLLTTYFFPVFLLDCEIIVRIFFFLLNLMTVLMLGLHYLWVLLMFSFSFVDIAVVVVNNREID